MCLEIRYYWILLLLITSGIAGTQALAQTAPGQQHRILVLLNGSQKMLNQWSAGENNYQVSSRIIASLIDSLYQINDEVEFGLRVYGHQQGIGERGCYDTKKEVMFSKDTRAQMKLRLKDIRPKGLAPLSFAIQEASNYDVIANDPYIYSLIIVTDGSVDCTDNTCSEMRELKKKLKFNTYVLQINSNEKFRSDYSCLGEFLPIKTEDNIRYAIGYIVQAYRKILPPKRPEETPVAKTTPSRPVTEPVDKPKTIAAPKAVQKEESIHLDTLKTGRIATSPQTKAVVISKNSRIKSEPDIKNGHAVLMNISRINHIAIYSADATEGSPMKDIFPVGLDVHKVELKAGKYRLVYVLYGYELGLEFTVEPGKETEVWLAR